MYEPSLYGWARHGLPFSQTVPSRHSVVMAPGSLPIAARLAESKREGRRAGAEESKKEYEVKPGMDPRRRICRCRVDEDGGRTGAPGLLGIPEISEATRKSCEDYFPREVGSSSPSRKTHAKCHCSGTAAPTEIPIVGMDSPKDRGAPRQLV
ncbi:hypothetical protein ACHAWF_018665 [Thalassiosira exigua]